MINVKQFNNALLVEGHAHFERHGYDIVCAGVSAIVMGALNWFDQEQTKIEVKDGYVLIVINEANQKSKEYLDLINMQLQAIAMNYQKYVCLHSFKTNYQGD